jgi:hypothetical protein
MLMDDTLAAVDHRVAKAMFESIMELQSKHHLTTVSSLITSEGFLEIGTDVSSENKESEETEGIEISSGDKVETTKDNNVNEIENLVVNEKSAKGMVSWWVLRRYINGMGKRVVSVCLASGIGAYTIMALNDLWLAFYLESFGTVPGSSGYTGVTTKEFVGAMLLGCVFSLLFFKLHLVRSRFALFLH